VRKTQVVLAPAGHEAAQLEVVVGYGDSGGLDGGTGM
jgi:hypothetical protein